MRCQKLWVVSFVCFIGSLNVFAVDWPQWRGTDQTGVSVETGLLEAWPQAGPELVWKATGLGQGFSSVAIVGSTVYTAGDVDGQSYVHAIDMGADKPKWSQLIGKAGAPGWGGFTGPRSTPTVADGKVYVLGQYGELVCFSAGDGTLVWKKHLVDDLGGKMPSWGYSESVLVDGDVVVCTPGGGQGTLAALNKTTGEVVWRSSQATDSAHYASIVKAEIEGVPQYVQLTDASVLGVALDGALLWRAERKGRTAVIPTPIVQGNLVYVASGYGVGSNLFEITQQNGEFKAAEKYATKTMANQHGGVILIGDYLYGYCDSKGWTCQALATGEPVWVEKGQVGKGSLTSAEGMLVLRSEKGGEVALIKVTPDGYEQTGKFIQPDVGKPMTWAHPVISGKKLYLRDQDQLLCYDVAAK
ncbi:MAG: PQQ-like beta-propeller repeat protein [Phycisphaerae bacterium]|nr:PQQ-like beta-propeller repeat protein [Phycisphaerae bacterium]